ncbi:MAG TPA: CHAP domain-containing protein [Chitinophagales bacterium]|nr:CHAP domain-containing protein [Chitinophagales bacterium]
MNKLRWFFIIVLIIAAGIGIKLVYFYAPYEIGEPIDSLNHVQVFYNGSTANVLERNTTSDNYNLGLKYQCIEFVKRYYYEFLQHKMPDSYGHAKDFFNPVIADGQLNTQRNLLQFTNGSKSQPKVNDILVLDKSRTNLYGHVAIISAVEGGYIEIIQQNAGKYATSRDIMELVQEEGKWVIKNDRVLGWLRIKN